MPYLLEMPVRNWVILREFSYGIVDARPLVKRWIDLLLGQLSDTC
jgi:hypothetical protein